MHFDSDMMETDCEDERSGELKLYPPKKGLREGNRKDFKRALKWRG